MHVEMRWQRVAASHGFRECPLRSRPLSESVTDASVTLSDTDGVRTTTDCLSPSPARELSLGLSKYSLHHWDDKDNVIPG